MNRASLEAKIQSLIQQEQQAAALIQQCRGARALAEQLLREMDDEASEKAVLAEKNGEGEKVPVGATPAKARR